MCLQLGDGILKEDMRISGHVMDKKMGSVARLRVWQTEAPGSSSTSAEGVMFTQCAVGNQVAPLNTSHSYTEMW